MANIALVEEWWDRYGDKTKKNKINEIINAINNLSIVDIDINSDIVPAADNSYDLGLSSKRWKDGYFAGNLGVGGYGNFGSLKIGGTEVIDSSRNLKNIASGNLSGNLEVGGDVTVTKTNGEGVLKVKGDGTAKPSYAYMGLEDSVNNRGWYFSHRKESGHENHLHMYYYDGSWHKLIDVDTGGNLEIGGNFEVGGTLRVKGNKILDNSSVERIILGEYTRVKPRWVYAGRSDNILGLMPIFLNNAFGFNPPYKVEKSTDGGSTWSDVTNSYDWSLITDLKGTEVAISASANQDVMLRFYFDVDAWEGGDLTAIGFAMRWISSLKYVKVESSNYSDFSQDVSTRLEWSGSINHWDEKTIWLLDSRTNGHKYVRITITIMRTIDGQMRIRQIVGFGYASATTLMERWMPFDWDYNKNINISGNLTVGGDLRVNGNDIKDSGGNVRITLGGTSLIHGNLRIQTTSSNLLYLDNQYSAQGQWGYLDFRLKDSAGNMDTFARVRGGNVVWNSGNESGNIKWDVMSGGSLKNRMTLDSAGNLTISGSLSQGSTIENKRVLGDFNIDFLGFLDNLKLKRFIRIDVDEFMQQEEFGLVAEEVPKELQTFSDEGKIYGINMSRLVFILLGAIKQLKTKIGV